jgi:uncharacterized RDD family membrane protein YckC
MPAGLTDGRLVAGVIDGFLIYIWALGLNIVFHTVTDERMNSFLVFSYALIFPTVALALTCGIQGQTIGMRLRHLWICDRDGNPVSSILRFSRTLAGLITLPIFPVSIIMSALDPLHRTISDRIMGTTVCKLRDRKLER